MSRIQSSIRVMPQSNKKWMAALTASTLAGLSLLVWSHQQAQQGSPVTSAVHVPQVADGRLAGDMQSLASLDVKALAAQQSAAAKVLAQQPDLKPIVGVVSERPPYVSRFEWILLQGVAMQQPNPDEQLNHLVNFLRFNKQLELRDELPRDVANAARRQGLAQALIDDLPQRLRSGDMDLKGAQKLQADLLLEAEPDAQRRQQRATQEAQRLQEAQVAAAAAAPAP